MAVDSIFQGFEGMAGLGQTVMSIGMWVLYGVIGLIFLGVPLVMLIIFMITKSKEKIVEEINIDNKRIKGFNAREKKTKTGQLQFYVGGKFKKFLPKVQAKDIFIKGKKDKVFLLKDNNGLHHTLRVPTHKEITKWYEVVHGIDINKLKEVAEKNVDNPDDKEKGFTIIDRLKQGLKWKKEELTNEILTILGTIYFLPNPAEDNEWLADKCMEADRKYATGFLKHPVAIVLGTIALMVFLTIIWLIIMKKM